MKKEDIKGTLLWMLALGGIGLALAAMVALPSFDFNGTEVRLFAPNRLVRPDRFRGRVLGDRLLETEHGEIKLRHLSEVIAGTSGIARIEIEEFREGRASHNMVVNGIEFPPDVSVSFNDLNRILSIRMHGRSLAAQEVIVSGIPLDIFRIRINPRESAADIVIEKNVAPEYITLADSTQIYMRGGGGVLGLLVCTLLKGYGNCKRGAGGIILPDCPAKPSLQCTG